jgi:hypothetical protein
MQPDSIGICTLFTFAPLSRLRSLLFDGIFLSMDHKILVGILDDHPPIIEGYISRLRDQAKIEVAWSAPTGEAMDKLISQTPVDVILLDIVVPVSEANRSPYPILSVIPRLLQTYPDLA